MKRALHWLAVGLLSLMLLVSGALVVLDSDIGHRWVVDRIAAQRPSSGLRIEIGRIDGSLFGRGQLRSLRLSDAKGRFFEAPVVTLDWRPAAWLGNVLSVRELSAETATLYRLPQLKSGPRRTSILPDFDIHIGKFSIRRLRIEPEIAGAQRIGRLSGQADLRDGRALISLGAASNAGDRLKLHLDAIPDRNRFDLVAHLSAPGDGIFARLVGSRRAIRLDLAGQGDWQAWRGTLASSVGGTPIAQLDLDARAGKFSLSGNVTPQSITRGKLQRLTSPVVGVRGTAELLRRRLDGSLSLTSPALAVVARGALDFAENRFSGLEIDARLIRPAALFANMGGRDIRLAARLDGPFASARFDYLLSAPQLAFGKAGFEAVRASGQGRLSKSPVMLPVRLTARRVTGIGDVAGGILANLALDGTLAVTSATITGDDLRFVSDKLSGRLNLFMDLKTGRYDIGLAGQLNRYLIPGLGIVDVKTELKLVPGEAGQGSRISGRGQAWVRRFDNRFLAGLAGGLPMIETGLVRGPDGALQLVNLRLRAPALQISGNGQRRADGSFAFSGSGTQARYGALKLVLDGRIERPKLDLLFARPNDPLGLANVALHLEPDMAGYGWRAGGGSLLGAFSGQGRIELPRGADAQISVADLMAGGSHASGLLVSRDGALAGRLTLRDGPLGGTLDFAPAATIQRIEAHLRARDLSLAGPPLLRARRGQFDGVVLLDPAGTSVSGVFTGQGLARGGVTLARLAANLDLKAGVGQIRASFAGSRGRSFEIQTVADISADTVSLIGSGTIDRRPIALTSPARLSRAGDGWRLAPATLSFAGGSARVAGLFGGSSTEVDAEVSKMPLAIIDILAPRLGLGGSANGNLSYRMPASGTPSGHADLRVRGLTRSGLVLSSRPVDLGVNAVLANGSAAVRAVAMSGGQIVGRAQARLTPGTSGDLAQRLERAPLFAQVRYTGPADTLWRLTGIEAFDVSGPVALGADISGRVDTPSIRGSVRTSAVRIESPVTGMVLTNVAVNGRFGGSKLVLDRFTAQAGKDGQINGSGSFDFAAPNGIGMALQIDAKQAALIARDELATRVTGPLTIRSDGAGGVIAGEVVIDSGRYRLGQATAAQAIAQLDVREINGRADEAQPRAAQAPWRLALKAKSPGRLTVTGLGMDSLWRADLEIGGSAVAPVIVGRADLVRGGYEFAGRRFELSRGVIRFQGENPPDPILDIQAQGDTQGLNATIRVTGSGQRPVISFASTPALPEDELLSRLLFGTSITNLSAPEAVQLAAAVASLRGGKGDLNPINALRSAIGLDRLRILPADVATGQGTSIAAGKYLSRRAFVEIITDGQGYSATRAEFQVTRWLSLLSTISTLGRQSATVRISKDY